MKKILTVSVLAMAAVGAANATIVSESMLSSTTGKYNSQNTVEMAIAAAQAAAEAAQTAAGNVGSASVAIAQGADNANKIMITDNSGRVTTTATIPANQVSGLSNALSDKVAVAQNVSNGVMITDGSGNVTAAATIAQSKVDGLTSALDDKQDVSNMVTAITGQEYNSALGSTDLYPSMKTAGKMISNAMGTTTTDITNLQNTYVKHSSNTAAGSATVPVYVAEDGTATPITSYAGNAATATNVAWSGVTNKPTINGESMETNVVLDAADVGAVAAVQANNGNKAMITDNSGNVVPGQITNGMVATGIDASKINALASVLSATIGDTEGNFVLTAKVANNEVTYHWEDLGR